MFCLLTIAVMLKNDVTVEFQHSANDPSKVY